MADPLPDTNALFRLDGRVALITGAAEGMGREIARYFAAAGAVVALADVNAAGAEAAAADLVAAGAQAIALTMDQSDEGQVKAALNSVRDRLGRIDILVNNAAIQDRALLLETDAALLDRLYAVNLRGPFLCLREAALAMRGDGLGGVIVNMGSAGGVHPIAEGLTGYNAMKGALHAVTRQAALELAPFGIRTNAIMPGPVPTAGSMRAPGPLVSDKLMAKMPPPIGRMGTPQDIAAVALFLASDAAAYVNGHMLLADGGFLLS